MIGYISLYKWHHCYHVSVNTKVKSRKHLQI